MRFVDTMYSVKVDSRVLMPAAWSCLAFQDQPHEEEMTEEAEKQGRRQGESRELAVAQKPSKCPVF